MAIQSEVFSTSFGVRTFASTKPIATKQHMAVWLKRVSDNVWVQASVNSFELINNSAVLEEAPNQATYSLIEIRVADEPDELGTSRSDIAILASLHAQVEAVGNNISNVNTVATNIASVNTTASNVANVNTVASSISNVNSVATTIVPNISEILLADDNATIATSKASEASTSAGEALSYRNTASTHATTATTQAGIATTKASEASAYAGSASTSATTATAQAEIASIQANISLISASRASNSQVSSALSASNAKLSEEVVLDYVAVYSTNFHNGEFISNDNTTSEDFGTIVGSISPFSAEATTAYRTDLAISSGSIDCGSL